MAKVYEVVPEKSDDSKDDEDNDDNESTEDRGKLAKVHQPKEPPTLEATSLGPGHQDWLNSTEWLWTRAQMGGASTIAPPHYELA